MVSVEEEPISAQIKRMRKDKGGTCVSVIIPLYHLSADQREDKAHIENAVKEASEKLLVNYADDALFLSEKLKLISEEIRFSRTDLGLGIFVSQNTAITSYFPFPVEETIAVQQSFRLKELLLKEQYSLSYTILYIDERKARLFSGVLKTVQEINNQNFPVTNVDDYAYAFPSRSSSYAGSAHVKSFENDKSAAKKKRAEYFLAEIDELLDHSTQTIGPMIVCGPRRITSAFVNRSKHANAIISIINGNYEDYTAANFSQLTWPAIEKYLAEKMIDEVNEFLEKTGEGLTEYGLDNIWDASVEGRVAKLLVEKDFKAEGYLELYNPYILYLKEPRQEYKILDNVVEDLIDLVLEKEGKISFLENKMLSKYQHIAAITRY